MKAFGRRRLRTISINEFCEGTSNLVISGSGGKGRKLGLARKLCVLQIVCQTWNLTYSYVTGNLSGVLSENEAVRRERLTDSNV